MRKCLVLILSVILFMNPMVLAGNVENNITDKILISIDEVVLSDTKFKYSSFFNLKIYNNDDVAYKLKHLYSGVLDHKFKIKDLYKYYLKENATEGRFPLTFEPHLCAILSLITPVTLIMYLAAFPDDCFKENVDMFITTPVKSIVLIPTNVVYKVKEANRNKKIRAELSKYFKMKDIIEYDSFEGLTIEPGVELQIPLPMNDYYLFFQNTKTNEEFRFDENGLIGR